MADKNLAIVAGLVLLFVVARSDALGALGGLFGGDNGEDERPPGDPMAAFVNPKPGEHTAANAFVPDPDIEQFSLGSFALDLGVDAAKGGFLELSGIGPLLDTDFGAVGGNVATGFGAVLDFATTPLPGTGWIGSAGKTFAGWINPFD